MNEGPNESGHNHPENKETYHDQVERFFNTFQFVLKQVGVRQELASLHPDANEPMPSQYHLPIPRGMVDVAFRMGGSDERVTDAWLTYYEPHMTAEGKPVRFDEVILDIRTRAQHEQEADPKYYQKIYAFYKLSAKDYDASVSVDDVPPDHVTVDPAEHEDAILLRLLQEHVARDLEPKEAAGLERLREFVSLFY